MTEIEDIPLSVADPEAAARFYARLLRRTPLEAGPDRAVFILSTRRTLSLWRSAQPASRPGDALELRMKAPSVVDELHMDWWDRGARSDLHTQDTRGSRARGASG
ncbi:MAG: glyoxalase, partial [Pseudomonadota bacterium]|nr:glyoxalase [Pseudomonadota bacterium]